jgi:hypothetical protein
MNGTTQYRKQIEQQNNAFLKGLPSAEKDARITGEFFQVNPMMVYV